MTRAIARSHERQFNGEDWQAVSIDIATKLGIKFEDDEYRQLNSSPDPGCDCGFCENAEWPND